MIKSNKSSYLQPRPCCSKVFVGLYQKQSRPSETDNDFNKRSLCSLLRSLSWFSHAMSSLQSGSIWKSIVQVSFSSQKGPPYSLTLSSTPQKALQNFQDRIMVALSFICFFCLEPQRKASGGRDNVVTPLRLSHSASCNLRDREGSLHLK